MRLWKIFFGVAAFFNLLVGGAMFAGAQVVAQHMHADTPIGLYLIMMVGAMIAVFGLGYALVASDPVRNRALVIVGVVGKLGAVAIALMNRAALPESTFWLSMGDLPFALAFIAFLVSTQRQHS